MGRMSPEKNPQHSILALIELRKRGVNARLIYVGIRVEVPIKLLERPVTQDLKLLHIGYIESVMLPVDLFHHGGQIVVDPEVML